MKAKVIFEDDGDNIIVSTEGAMAEQGTVAQNAAMAVFNRFTRETRVKIKKPNCYREYQSSGTLPCEVQCEFTKDCKRESSIKYKEYNDWVKDNVTS